MKDNAARLHSTGVFYYPYLEPDHGAGKGLLCELGKRACVVVTDDFPSFFLPRMVASAARQVSILMEKVDSNGLLPIHWTDRVFLTAFSFRRFLQNNIEPHLHSLPKSDPLADGVRPFDGKLPGEFWTDGHRHTISSSPCVKDLWLPFPLITQSRHRRSTGESVQQVEPWGSFSKRDSIDTRIAETILMTMPRAASHPICILVTSQSYQVFQELMDREGWSKNRIWPGGRGQREGWWGMSRSAEAFLDQLITWRELGYNMCAHMPLYDRYESLPAWAQESLDRHRKDPRPYLYGLERFEDAETHDPLWNAAQRQLRKEGRLHNYLRMLWGKKILEWTRSPEEALDIMIHLNNKYALDGRNPNSYSGIFWILGRYDRPWAPERPVFGRIRYMSSQNTGRKLRLKQYLSKYSE